MLYAFTQKFLQTLNWPQISFQLNCFAPQGLFVRHECKWIYKQGPGCFYSGPLQSRINVLKPAKLGLFFLFFFSCKGINFQPKLNGLSDDGPTSDQGISLFCNNCFLQPLVSRHRNLVLLQISYCFVDNLLNQRGVCLSFLQLCCSHVNRVISWIHISCTV